MIKQSVIYLLFSVLVVIFAQYAHLLVVYFVMLYTLINIKLTPILNEIGFGTAVCKVLLLAFIPITIVTLPALSYRLIKGKNMPYFIETTWCLWLVLVLSTILIRY